MSGALPLRSRTVHAFMAWTGTYLSLLYVTEFFQPLGLDTNSCREAILSGSLNNCMILLITNSHYFGKCTNISIFCTCNH